MAIASAAIYGTIAILTKYAYAAGITVDQLLALRFIIAACVMLPAALIVGRGSLRMSPSSIAALGLLGLVGYGGQTLAFFSALKSMPASLVELIFYVYPGLVVTANWWLYGRRVTLTTGLVLMVNFVGLCLLIGGGPVILSSTLLLVVLIPIGFAALLLISERLLIDKPALSATAVIVSGTAIFWFLLAAVTEEVRSPSNTTAWLTLAAITVGGLIAVTLIFAALARIGSARVSVLSTCEPVVTVALAVLLLGERLGGLEAIGALAILASIVYLQWFQPGTSRLTTSPRDASDAGPACGGR
jgi:drug/metabolite transporter (DMT)-like permease